MIALSFLAGIIVGASAILGLAFRPGAKSSRAKAAVAPPPVETVDQYIERLNGNSLLLPRGQA
jgi:hypothetical protein